MVDTVVVLPLAAIPQLPQLVPMILLSEVRAQHRRPEHTVLRLEVIPQHQQPEHTALLLEAAQLHPEMTAMLFLQ